MSLISDAVETHQVALPEGGVLGECAGSKFHSPTPLVVYRPVVGGVLQPWLCGTCRDNLVLFVALFEAAPAMLPWEVRRQFGNPIRDLGMRILAHQRESRRA